MKVINLKVVLETARDQKPQYDLILLHPFKDKPGLYRDALEGLLQLPETLENTKGRGNAYSCSFNGSEITTGKTTIDTVSRKLFSKLRKQRALPESKDNPPRQPLGDKAVTQAENEDDQTVSITNDHAQAALPALIFITHSIGSWVARHMLTQTNEPTASIFNTTGMILLDDLDSENLDNTKVQKYLDTILAMLSEHEKYPVLDQSSSRDLILNLLSVNQKFQLLQSECNHEALPRQSRFNIWITEPTADNDPQKVARVMRILSWVNNLRRHESKKARGKNNANRLKSDEIKNAIKNLLTQPLLTSVPMHPKHLQGADHQDDTIHDNSQDGDAMEPNVSHGIIQRGTLPELARSPNRQSIASDYSLPAWSIVSNNERISVGSYPDVILNSTTDKNLKKTIDLGHAFLRKGELKSAEIAFLRCRPILEDLEPREKLRYDVHIQAQLAGIKLYRGSYEAALKEFHVVLSRMNHVFSNGERNAVMGWIATSLLYKGDYQQAIRGFKSLLVEMHEQNPSNAILAVEIPIRRDLALAYAYQGNHQQAFMQINTARDCLEKLIKPSTSSSELVSQPFSPNKAKLTETSNPALATVSEGSSELAANGVSPTLDEKTLKENAAKKDHIYLTESKIHYIHGDFQAALKVATNGLQGMLQRWGVTHLKTLECASQRSILLALNSRISKAEEACNETLAMTQRQLGAKHPQTLEAVEHLVSIFLFQSRLVEAADTAKSLAKDAETSLSVEHPQTHRAKYLVAETLLAIGDYASAEDQLESVISDAKNVYEECHPDTVHYQSRLALVRYHQGKLQEAEFLAIYALQEQWSLYIISSSKKELPRTTHNALRPLRSMNTLFEYQGTLKDVLIRIRKDAATLSIHPRLLQTLRTVALIAQRCEGLEDIGFSVILAIWERNKSYLTQSSIFTLNSEYDLALVYREEAEGTRTEELLNEAASHFRSVYQGRFRLLGLNNADTISARRELITTNCTLGHWEPSLALDETEYTDGEEKSWVHDQNICRLDNTRWGRVLAESKEIVDQHEGSIGKNHTETLKSLLWLLTVQVLLRQEKEAKETLQKGLLRLRLASIRKERFIESLNLEQKFALAVSDLGRKCEVKSRT
ncbi:hypothetical protein F4678DRAFT_241697 [Xylaria arbuscula]|nr:hypothetical protein F4678DRAFT_241697 [Xylaria arbuscula]